MFSECTICGMQVLAETPELICITEHPSSSEEYAAGALDWDQGPTWFRRSEVALRSNADGTMDADMTNETAARKGYI